MKTFEEIIPKSLVERIKADNAKADANQPFEDNGNLNPDVRLFQKWAHKVPKGWYGFSLGHNVPMSWATAIDSFLEAIQNQGIDFEIHQIKLKFGGLRFYILMKSDEANPVLTDDIHKFNLMISNLEGLLVTENLVY
jgi:hypothetical protein